MREREGPLCCSCESHQGTGGQEISFIQNVYTFFLIGNLYCVSFYPFSTTIVLSDFFLLLLFLFSYVILSIQITRLVIRELVFPLL